MVDLINECLDDYRVILSHSGRGRCLAVLYIIKHDSAGTCLYEAEVQVYICRATLSE